MAAPARLSAEIIARTVRPSRPVIPSKSRRGTALACLWLKRSVIFIGKESFQLVKVDKRISVAAVNGLDRAVFHPAAQKSLVDVASGVLRLDLRNCFRNSSNSYHDKAPFGLKIKSAYRSRTFTMRK